MLINNQPSVGSVHRNRGITLIEALIALFIMSIGLLGVAGLQATSIAAGHASGQRSLAVFHSAEMAERMRANGSAGVAYDTTVTVPSNANGCSDISGTEAALCTTAQVAAEDLFQWQASLDQAFVNMGTAGSFGTITINAGTVPPTAIINISWTERGDVMNYTSTFGLEP